MRGLLLTLIICMLSLPAPAKYSGGTGDPNDPYQIATAADLIALGETPADYDKHFVLTADIDLNPNLPGGKVFDKAVVAPDIDAAEAGFQGNSFVGVFDGNWHAIRRLKAAGASYLGLFGQVESGGEIRNLGVADVNIAGSGDYIGALAGYSRGDIATSYATGTISGGKRVGGFTGRSWGSIGASYSTATIIAGEYAGGLAGGNYGSIVTCYSTGAVTANRDAGGLIGENYGSISASYSTGRVTGDTSLGGLVAHRGEDANVTSSFWDTQTSGQTESASGMGKGTSEMQKGKTFTDAKWDLAGETANGTQDVWWIDEGKNYPRLWWEPRKYGGGTGEPNDPYLIFTAEQMNAIGAEPNDWGKCFQLMADIDLSGFDGKAGRPAFYVIGDCYRWTNGIDSSVGGAPFTGVFDGNGKTVSHLMTMKGCGNLRGLFGGVGPRGLVKNLRVVVDVNVDGTENIVGALAGYNGGTVSRCSSEGVITGKGWTPVGGLIGWNYAGTITDCRSTTTVSGGYGVGGLVSVNSGWRSGGVSVQARVLQCYSAGRVSGNAYYSDNRLVGGLIGTGGGEVVASFWDTEASGQTASAGGVGKTTAQLHDPNTFVAAGWDFVGETDNGTEGIWWIDEGTDYPRLWWEALD